MEVRISHKREDKCGLIMKRERTKRKHILLVRIRKVDKGLGTFFQNSAIGQVCIAIILAAAVALTSSAWNDLKKSRNYYDRINELCIGLNQEYVDSFLGFPTFLTYYDEYEVTESVYTSKYSVVRCYYAQERLVGFFVTGRDGCGRKLGISQQISSFTKGKSLGEYTFSDIQFPPQKACGYFTNGIGYAAYFEEAYFNSFGLYHMYYYGIMDYGFKRFEPISYENYMEDETVAKMSEVDVSMPYYYDRSKSYPNTYGVCENDYQTIIPGLAMEYTRYDFSEYFPQKDYSDYGLYFFGPYKD